MTQGVVRQSERASLVDDTTEAPDFEQSLAESLAAESM
jgi:hypothetical protein